MNTLSESKSVESKVTEWLSQMGYTFMSANELKHYNRLQMNAVIEPILVEKVMSINNISENDAKSAVETLLARKPFI